MNRRNRIWPALLGLAGIACGAGGARTDGRNQMNGTPVLGECGLAAAAGSDYEPIWPPVGNIPIGTEVSRDGPYLGSGVESVREMPSLSNLSCTDSATFKGGLTFKLAGIVSLGGGNTRSAAEGFVLEGMSVIQVADIQSLELEIGRRYLWSAVRLDSFRFDAARVSGIGVELAAERLNTRLQIGGQRRRGQTLGYEGLHLFVGERIVEFQSVDRDLVAEFVVAQNDRRLQFSMGSDYDLAFMPANTGSVLEVRYITGASDTITIPELFVPDRSWILREVHRGGGFDTDRLTVQRLDFRGAVAQPEEKGVSGVFRIERQRVDFRTVSRGG